MSEFNRMNITAEESQGTTPARKVKPFWLVVSAILAAVSVYSYQSMAVGDTAKSLLSADLRGSDFVINYDYYDGGERPWEAIDVPSEPLVRGDFELLTYLNDSVAQGYDPFGSVNPMDPSLPLWANCTEIQITVHYDYRLSWHWRAVMDFESLKAVSSLRTLTGLNLVDPVDGTLSVIDRSPTPTSNQIDIIWINDEEVAFGDNDPKTVAYTNLLFRKSETEASTISKAQVFLPVSILRSRPIPMNTPTVARGETARTAVLHELGHAVGLGHAAAQADSIMAPTHNDRTSLSMPDRVAFRHSGGRPCQVADGSEVTSGAALANLGFELHTVEESLVTSEGTAGHHHG